MPRLSVITINFNNKAGLQKTFDSVFEQGYKDFEYIVIDGGSADSSKSLIEQHADKLAYWVSEKDAGVYNAMNKAIEKSTGDYLLFLNSGDYLYTSSIMENAMSKINNEDIVYGNLLIKETTHDWEKKYPGKLSLDYFVNDTIPHSGAAFIKRRLFEKIGLYNEAVYITSDWRFYMDAVFKHDVITKYLDEIIAVFVFDGISSKPENHELIQSEKRAFLENDFQHYFKLHSEAEYYKQQYLLLANSRLIKVYQTIKKIFGKG